MGKLIVIEGTDGSGKTTQAPLLASWIRDNICDCLEISFPCYESPSSQLVKMYLAGEMGSDANDVNAYSASAFYAVDRFASYKKEDGWGSFYDSGGLVLATRYTTANMVHQTGKLPFSRWGEYIDWLEDFEYGRMGIPKPDLVILLDMPVETAQKLMSGRYGGNEGKKDIHERDVSYLKHCRKAALFAAERCGWRVVDCAENGRPLSVLEIHQKIINCVKPHRQAQI